MAYKIQIVDDKNGVSFNGRYENLSRAEKPEIVAKNANGDVVKNVTVYNNQVLGPGSTTKEWRDDKGNAYAKSELKFYLGDEEVAEVEQTKVFTIEGFQPLSNYTDTYIISTYYELFADDNGMKKDIDKQRAVQANTSQMYKLWEYLYVNALVARGEFCPSTRGFVASDGYIRAITINGKWGLEVGVFKEQKTFLYLNEGKPQDIQLAPADDAPKKTRIKRI